MHSNTMKSLKRSVLAAITILGIVAMVLGLLSCSSEGYSGKVDSITIGLTPFEYSGLVYIAKERGFFTANGINMTVRDYNTTLQAMDGLLNGEVNIAGTTEYVIVGKTLNKGSFSIIGNIDKYSSVFLAGRKDKGIERVTDLKGKKVGVTRGTIGEFYLSRFLDLNGMSIRDVILVDLSPAQYVQAPIDGTVDAIITVRSFITEIQKQLGSNVVLWPAQSHQNGYFSLVCRNDWVTGSREVIDRVLISLEQANQYAVKNPDKAREIVVKTLGSDDTYMKSAWADHQISLSLDQSLIIAMEDEARWLMQNNLTAERQMPDLRSYIYIDGLKTIKPDAVNIR
jgi:ABC-type nitrate/sulfonate/bicarbonate transport system substrate-binding protein